MAKNFNSRRSMGIYTQNIEEGSERLKLVLGNLHYMDKAAIAELMSGLDHLSLANIQAAIEMADASMQVANTLREVPTNVKKYKEVRAKLNRKDELAHMRQRQSGALMCSVFIYLTNCIFLFSNFLPGCV